MAVAQAPSGGVSAWVQPEGPGTGVNAFGVWTLGRLFQMAAAIGFLVLVCFFMLVASRQLAANWEHEVNSEEWRPFAKGGKAYGVGSLHNADDSLHNPWREGSGVIKASNSSNYNPATNTAGRHGSSAEMARAKSGTGYDALPTWAS